MATFKQTIEGMKAMEQPENQQPKQHQVTEAKVPEGRFLKDDPYYKLVADKKPKAYREHLFYPEGDKLALHGTAGERLGEFANEDEVKKFVDAKYSQKSNPVTYFKPLSKEEGEDMRKKGMTEDEYRYKQASDRAILMGEQIPDKNEYMKGLAAKREAMQNQPKKTAGEIAKEMYEDIFFKEAKGNKEDFVNRWLNMGVPRGFSRKELADFYGKRFDELSANQPKAQQPKQGSFERAIRDIGDDED